MPILCLAEKDTGVEESESSKALAALPRLLSESERGIVKEKEDGEYWFFWQFIHLILT